jgi:epoxyqueuosine reductase
LESKASGGSCILFIAGFLFGKSMTRSLATWEFGESLKSYLQERGFELVGFTPLRPYAEFVHFESWLERGFAGGMHYMERRRWERLHPNEVWPWARSVICVGALYNTRRERSVDLDDPGKGWISRYAWGDDYHKFIKRRLQDLLNAFQKKWKAGFHYAVYVDTGPLLERIFAYHAGLGWIGKNSCLIHPRYGSFFFLGTVLIDRELPPSTERVPDRCGSCQRCMEACPTGAIVEPRIVDSRKCISYLTIEHRGDIPASLSRKMGTHLFGCDICQEVCPWNRKAPLSAEAAFQPKSGFFQPDLQEFRDLVLHRYPQGFQRSPLKRAKKEGLLRNANIALCNSASRQEG